MAINVDNYPYFPYLLANATDIISIKRVVLMVLLAAQPHSISFDDDADDDVPDHNHDEGGHDHHRLAIHGTSSRNGGGHRGNSDFVSDEEAEVHTLLTVTPVVGGNTNKLFRVTGLHAAADKLHATLTVSADSVLVRIFSEHGLVDRDMDTSVYASLARQNLAFRYYGRFANGRLEEWCPWPNVTTMTEEHMANPILSKAIAVELANLHYRFDETKCSQPLPTDKLLLWKQLEDWLESALDLTERKKFKTSQDNERVRTLNPSLHAMKDELHWLRSSVIKDGGSSNCISNNCDGQEKVGFCHNDLLASNILWNGEMDTDNMNVRLIDFEYGGWNYFCYDIANHFNEFAGGTAPQHNGVTDYSKFPSPQFQRSFCREYLAGKQWVLQQSQEPIKESDVEGLYDEVQGFVLANHLIWSLWAVNSAASDGCDNFDFLKYAQARLTRYLFVKDVLYHTKKQEVR
jgi:ethanolamine kinase